MSITELDLSVQSDTYWLIVLRLRLVFILREAWRQKALVELLDRLVPWVNEVFNDN